ncbi:hypothetical protein 2 [Beihai tombus-like virus 9]|uniref:hypothetical protein 2 n=1 Tax=Beihai tombus-like virus 9 TaxID=1922730 RepID=UPI00090A0313|nr:hypothetical protein 2 [Beihai tombus-like virus 9]APG76191.1 hypothetical protein 2 [Beihai tombus-like virus 9]
MWHFRPLAGNSIPGLYHPFSHSNCVKNEITAAANRVMMETTEGTDHYYVFINQLADKIGKELGHCDAWEDERVIAHYSGRKAARYARAARNLAVRGFKTKDARITGFIKPDKYEFDVCLVKDPRMIQYRTPEYSFLLAKFLKPMEKRLYGYVGSGKPGDFPNTPWVAKGLNNETRAELLHAKAGKFKDPVFICADASRFDAYVKKRKLQAEHRVYRRQNRSGLLKRLLKLQLNNKCKTRNGVKYKTVGKRMSGDQNTALGNCIVNGLSIVYVNRHWVSDFMVDGDDSVIIMERDDYDADRLQTLFDSTGFKITWELADHITKVEFCSSKIIPFVGGYKFVNMPWRTLSNGTVGSRPRPHTYWVHRMRADAIGLYSVMKGIPILQEYALTWIQATNGIKPLDLSGEAEWHKFRLHTDYGLHAKMKWLNVDILRLSIMPETRVAFERAFGISIGLQCLTEQLISTCYKDYVFKLQQQIGTINIHSHRLDHNHLMTAW